MARMPPIPRQNSGRDLWPRGTVLDLRAGLLELAEALSHVDGEDETETAAGTNKVWLTPPTSTARSVSTRRGDSEEEMNTNTPTHKHPVPATPDIRLTARFGEALAYAADKHRDDWRKTQPGDPWPPVPYISHPIAVAALVIEHGGSEDQAIAALLHDVAEDHGGEAALLEISKRFGPQVADIVRHCSDDLPAEGKDKKPWQERKQAYIASLADKPLDALFVSCADKLHNARSILADHRRLGNDVYRRFKPGRHSAIEGRDKTLWYFQQLAAAFIERLDTAGGKALAEELERIVTELRRRS